MVMPRLHRFRCRQIAVSVLDKGQSEGIGPFYFVIKFPIYQWKNKVML